MRIKISNKNGDFVGVVQEYEIRFGQFEVELEEIRKYGWFAREGYGQPMPLLLLKNGTKPFVEEQRVLRRFVQIKISGVKKPVKIELSDQRKSLEPLDETAQSVRVLRKPTPASGVVETPEIPQEPCAPSLERACSILGARLEASNDRIEEAYQRVIREYHPDRVQHMGERLRVLAREETKRINEAYAVILKGLKARHTSRVEQSRLGQMNQPVEIRVAHGSALGCPNVPSNPALYLSRP